MKFNLVWDAKTPELTPEHTAILAREIAWLEGRIDDASEIISHVVNLTDDFSGPSITLHGKEENKTDVFLTYNKKTTWVTLEDVEEYKDEV
jgi:hypothetical protein